MKIRKNDNVFIMTGKDRGKSGKVLQALPKEGRVVVQGMNMAKHHQRPRKTGEKGQILSKETPLDVSKVMVVCPKCAKPTRIGFRVEGGNKSRICKKCGATI
ncbi:50S ribosomal protein L24 [Candidatus Azambacteria bacterium]|nr:50S ribosomal protein L24 [Candidatus Azambacteria bacterium]MBI3685269.1 50S ribosomal protein L24 [Candidatus Azambacteria bacterium]